MHCVAEVEGYDVLQYEQCGSALFLTLSGHSSDERWVLMLWINPKQFLIPAVAQERVWSLVSPNPVFLVLSGSCGMLPDEGQVQGWWAQLRQTSVPALTLTPVQHLSVWWAAPVVQILNERQCFCFPACSGDWVTRGSAAVFECVDLWTNSVLVSRASRLFSTCSCRRF